MKLLDLYCGAGGAAMGYHRAGFEVVGVDIKEQPNYPFEFIQSDVFDLTPEFIDSFDIIHASPPCQAYLSVTKLYNNKDKNGNTYPDLLAATRELIKHKEYVIENVTTAKLIKPIVLCGTMFNLEVIRHRKFEINSGVWVYPPHKCNHKGTIRDGAYASIINGNVPRLYAGGYPGREAEERVNYKRGLIKRVSKYLINNGEAQYKSAWNSAIYLDWCDAMGIDWMSKYELTQAIPPAYTEWIGKRIISYEEKEGE